MYNQQIEDLINAALADGELTEKEKQILFKKAQEHAIDLDEFEMVLDARLVEIKKKEAALSQQQELELAKAKAAAQSNPAAPKSDKFGDVRKCPACGAMLQSFQTKCDECGYEFKNVEAVNSAQRLFDLLQAAELRKTERIAEHNKEKNRRLDELSKRHNSDSTFAKVFGGKSRKETQDEEREDLIRELNADLQEIENKAENEYGTIVKSFPVPNAKEDLLELLAMATSNAYDNDGVIGKREEVWIQKVDQIYQKIVVCAVNDRPLLEQATHMVTSLMMRLPDGRYKNFTIIPQSMRELADNELYADQKRRGENHKRIMRKYGVWVAPCLLFGILSICAFSAFSVIFGLLLVGVAAFGIRNASKEW